MFLLCFWALLKDADNNSSEVGQDISCTLFAGQPMQFSFGLALSFFSVSISISAHCHTVFRSTHLICLLIEYKIQNEQSAFTKYLAFKLTRSSIPKGVFVCLYTERKCVSVY